MKRSIIIGSLLVSVIILSSCKKEVFQPNSNRVVETECGNDTKFQHKVVGTGGENTGSTGTTGAITDPNDDDYTKRPTKTKK